MNTNTKTATETIAAEVVQVSNEIALLDTNDKLSTKQLAEKLNEIIALMNQMSKGNVVTRDRGPKSEKDMTEEDARRVILGDLEKESHKSAAEKLGLSYGQVYSARKGFTFKTIYKESLNRGKVAAE